MRISLPNKWLSLLSLLAILLLGAYLRFTGIDWDENYHLHPDERFLTMIETSIRCEDSHGDYFDTNKSTLNPHNVRDANGNQTFPFFVYGTLPIFLVRFIGETFNQTGYSQIHIVGRYLSGLFDLGTILLIFVIGKKTFKNEWVGIVSAAFYAFAPLPIQISHFFIVDNFTTFFTIAAFLFAILVYQKEKGTPQEVQEKASRFGYLVQNWSGIQYYAFFGVALGMAAASKVNAIVIALLLPIGILLTVPKGKFVIDSKRLHVQFRNLVLAAIISFIIFRIFQPYAFVGPTFFNIGINLEWLNDIKELQALSSGLSSYPPSLQWTRRSAFFPVKNMAIWGMGIAFSLLAFFGLMMMLIDMLKGEKDISLLIFIWNMAYIIWQAARWNPTMRYFLLVYPTMAISAGWVLILGFNRLKFFGSRLETRKIFQSILIVLSIAASVAWGFAFVNIYKQPMTRIAASEWIYKNVEGPVNLLFDAGSSASLQPLPFRKTFSLAPAEKISIDFFSEEAFTADQIVIEHVLPGDQQGEQYLKVKLGVKGSDAVIYEGNVLIPATATIDQRGSELVIKIPSLTQFNTGEAYTISFDAAALTAQIRLMGSMQLRNGLSPAILSRSVFFFSQRIEPNGVFESSFFPIEDNLISAVKIYRLRSTTLDARPLNIMVEVVDPESGTVLAQGQQEIIADASADSRGTSVVIPLSDSIGLQQDKSYSIRIHNQDNDFPLFISGSLSAKETDWDDTLPLYMYGLNPFDLYSGVYQSDLNFQMYWDDNVDKLARFLSILDQADYIIMSSNRQWGSVTQAPEKYPLTTHLYRGLLNCDSDDVQTCYINAQPNAKVGMLGFELVKTFHVQPEIFGLRFNSQNAEEAFSVYDHPKVFIFKKADRFSYNSAVAYLEQVDLDHVLNLSPQEIEKRPGSLELPVARWFEQSISGTWSELFDSDGFQNTNQVASALLWYLFLTIIGLVMMPTMFIMFSGLRYKGWGLSRLFGLLILGYLVWLGGSLGIAVTRIFIAAVMAFLIVVNLLLFLRDRKQITAFLKLEKRSLINIELVFLAFFIIFLLIRFGNPDLWHPYKGGEKPMDFAYFNAVIKSIHFPPYDPWYSDGYINYYYWGFVLAAVPTKLLGILPSIAYNLFMPTFFAMTAVGAFTIGINLVKPSKKKEVAVGLVAACFVLIIGNLGTVRMIFQGFQRLGEAQLVTSGSNVLTPVLQFFSGVREFLRVGRFNFYPGDWYWIPSRAIPGEPITEFPFFTFLYGDPHAHLFAYPITLLSLSWAISVISQKWMYSNSLSKWASLAAGALIVGSLRPTNTWDLPVFLAVGGISVMYTYIKYGKQEMRVFPHVSSSTRKYLVAALHGLLFVTLSFVLFFPFARWYGQAYTAFSLWEGDKTPIWAYLLHWGIFIFIIFSWLICEVIDWLKATPLSILIEWRKKKGWFLVITAIIVVVWILMIFRGVSISLIAMPIVLTAFLLAWRKEVDDTKRMVLLMTSLGIGLTILVELIVLSGDIGRMNTVFKFYLQAWSFISIPAAYAFYDLVINRKIRLTSSWQTAWHTTLILLLISGLLYPLFATADKVNDRIASFAPSSLDGMDYMQYAQYPEDNVMMDLREDYQLIRWMQENIKGTPRIIEAHVPEYRWGSRISIYTGLPTVIGWNWHQRQQRAINPGDWVFDRVTDVQTFYATLDWQVVEKLIAQYQIDYVVIGQLERIVYPQDGIEKFSRAPENLFKTVYDDGNTVLLKVNQSDG